MDIHAPSKLIHSFSLQGWRLIDLPLRVASQFFISLSRVVWSILDCARRTSTFLSCAFREQEDNQVTLSSLLVFVARLVPRRRNPVALALLPQGFSRETEYLCAGRAAAVYSL